VKLLFDENLSYKLVQALSDLFPDSAHVTKIGLASGADDREVWQFARQNGFAIVTVTPTS
jgi:predicted nuclease of predicted toxin-antitoxin system